jgi:hypothetical protein
MRAAPDNTEAIARERSLQRLERLAVLLDNAFYIPGTRYRIGLDGLLGLIPGIGDATGTVLSAYLIFEAARIGAPVATLMRMGGNVAIETVVGVVPVLGDLFDVAWKSNIKNMALLQDHVARGDRLRTRSLQQIRRLFLFPLVAGAVAMIAFAIGVLTLVMRLLFG